MASNYRRDSARPIKLGRYATLDSDGTLHLPPIVRPKAEDPFANSKLLSYRLSRQKDAQLTKIVSVYFDIVFVIVDPLRPFSICHCLREYSKCCRIRVGGVLTKIFGVPKLPCEMTFTVQCHSFTCILLR